MSVPARGRVPSRSPLRPEGVERPAQAAHLGRAPPHIRPEVPDDREQLEQAARILDDLRVHLSELDRREQSLTSQLALLDQEQRALRLQSQEFAASVAERTSDLERRDAELGERECALAARTVELNRREEELRAQENSLKLARARMRDELEDELDVRYSQVAAAQADITQRRAALEAEIEEWRQRRQQEEYEHEERLSQMCDERLTALERREAELEEREADLRQRGIDIEKRARFHEEHLSRLRAGVQAQQAELERTRAALRVWRGQVEATIRDRLAHLRRYRDVLELREKGCDAAWHELQSERERQEAEFREQQQQIAAAQRAVDEERQARALELRRHEDLLRLREQELLRRSDRLDQMRDDLERQQQELRAREEALDAVVARLSDHVGQDVSSLLARLADPSTGVDENAAGSREARERIEEAERQLGQLHLALQRDREALSEMLADRERRLRIREATLARQFDQLAERERALQEARIRDRAEREQAEQLLQQLVAQLERMLDGPDEGASTVAN